MDVVLDWHQRGLSLPTAAGNMALVWSLGCDGSDGRLPELVGGLRGLVRAGRGWLELSCGWLGLAGVAPRCEWLGLVGTDMEDWGCFVGSGRSWFGRAGAGRVGRAMNRTGRPDRQCSCLQSWGTPGLKKKTRQHEENTRMRRLSV